MSSLKELSNAFEKTLELQRPTAAEKKIAQSPWTPLCNDAWIPQPDEENEEVLPTEKPPSIPPLVKYPLHIDSSVPVLEILQPAGHKIHELLSKYKLRQETEELKTWPVHGKDVIYNCTSPVSLDEYFCVDNIEGNRIWMPRQFRFIPCMSQLQIE